ncbi:MAG: PD-(D/E)XK nuclease family protein, partial [Gammaproteobacteria bacterium]
PMLPIAWARRLPLYQKQAVLAQAEDQIAQWRRAGAMFSWPAYEGETELAAVTAIADLPKQAYPSAPSVLQSLQGKLALEQIADRPVPLSAPQLRGGASAFTHQSLCPFRGFVRVRLGVRSLEEGHGGLNARERGIVLHRALQNFWQAFAPEQRTQGSLLRLSAQERSERITQAVERALHKLQTTRALTLSGRFLAHEQMRLQQALEKLIALDLDPARAAFTLIEIEDRRKVEFAGLQLNVQRDRVEEIDGHGRVVMDYKTGLVSASNWHGDRPKDLQLPLYAVLEAREGHALAGVLFAQFREGDWKFAGEVSTAGLFPTRAQSKRKPLDFSEALPAWESALNALADELRQGVARVDPQASACQFCGLQAACRIDPWQQDEDVQVGSGDSEMEAFA